jgi:hypothetical protein
VGGAWPGKITGTHHGNDHFCPKPTHAMMIPAIDQNFSAKMGLNLAYHDSEFVHPT